MGNFTPLSALIGGVLIGLSASLLILFNGRVAGVSRVIGGLVPPARGEIAWRLCFLVGLVIGASLWHAVGDPAASIHITSSTPILIAGGFLVGVGTQMGSGCTSGHGVCGIARLAPRSLVATASFMVAAFATVFVTRHLLGMGG